MSDSRLRRGVLKGADYLKKIWAPLFYVLTVLATIGGALTIFPEHPFKVADTPPVTAPPPAETDPKPGTPESVTEPPPKPQPRRDPYAYIDRYIDRTARGVPDKPNVALHIFEAGGRGVATIESVIQGRLRDRGIHVVPLFRRRFAQDGLDRELFRGNAELAGKLQLQNHCNKLFLGVVRIDGSPRNMQGLIFTDVTFNLREISVTDGSVGGEWHTSAKGGGLDVDSSVENALRELEDSIKNELGEWILS